jgi:hypothetical protein
MAPHILISPTPISYFSREQSVKQFTTVIGTRGYKRAAVDVDIRVGDMHEICTSRISCLASTLYSKDNLSHTGTVISL